MSDIMRMNEKYLIPWERIDFNQLVCSFEKKCIQTVRTTNSQYTEYEVYAAKFEDTQTDAGRNSTSVDTGITECQNEPVVEPVVYSTYLCHICNTTVPIMYAKAHINSTKHQSCLKIINTALERARQQMSHHIEDPIQPMMQNTYYCEPCSDVVAINEKAEHVFTTKHLQAVKRDANLEQLVNIYVDDGENQRDLVDVENVSEDVSSNDLEKYVKQLKVKFNKPDDFLTVISDNMVQVKAVDGSKATVSVAQFHGVLERSNMFCQLCNVCVGDDLSSHYMTETHMMKVATDVKDMHFIRQVMVGDTCSHCILCNRMVLVPDIHKRQDAHNMNVQAVPMLDIKLYLQKLSIVYPRAKSFKYINHEMVEVTALDGTSMEVSVNQFLGVGAEKNCNLCMENIEETHHFWAKGHMDKVVAPILDAHFLRDLGNSRSHCLLCHSTTNNTILHTQSEVHKYNLKIANAYQTKPISEQLKPVSEQLKPVSEQLKPVSEQPKPAVKATAVSNGTNDGVTFCKPCKRFIDTHNYQSHINGRIHKEMAAELVTAKENNIKNTIDPHMFMTSLVNQDVTCKVCKVHVPNNMLPTHIETLSHVAKFNSLLISNRISTLPTGFVCFICNVDVNKNDILNHVSMKTHTDKLTIKEIADNKVADKQEKTKDNYCFVCECKVPVGGMKVHENGAPHRSKLQVEVLVKTPSPEPRANDTKPQTYATAAKGHPHLEPTDNAKVVICKVCQAKVPTVNISEHVRGINHKGKLKDVLDINMFNESDKGYHCDCCEVNINIGDEVDHLASDGHKINLLKAKSKEYLHFTMRFTNNVKLLMCNVCEYNVLNGAIYVNGHVETPYHKQKYVDFLARNKIRKLKDGVHNCDLCAQLIKEDELFSHVKTEMHESKTYKHPQMEATDNVKVLNCKICKTGVPNIKANIIEHVNGQSHKAKSELITN